MNALLIEPKFGRTWGKNNQHVGLLRIGSWLKETGANVEYIQYPTLPERQPDEIYVTSMFTYDYPAVWEAVRQYKFLYPNAVMKLGGVYATICPDHARQSGADEVMVGRHPEARYYPPDPTLLPTRPKLAYLFTSYGCDRACTYCATHILFGKGIEQTEPGTVVDEVEFLVSRGFRHILFGDDNILYNAENHIVPVCEEILRRNIKATFEVPGGMTALNLTPDVIEIMTRTGFTEFSFGLESVSASVRKSMGRATHTSEEDLIRAVELCEAHGIKRQNIRVFFMIGLPYQKIEDMLDTLIFLLKLGVWVQPQRLTPIPNTVDWKRMGLEEWPLEDLHYQRFVAPNQDNFTGDDLRDITNITRVFNIGSRMTYNLSWLREDSRLYDRFRSQLKAAL